MVGATYCRSCTLGVDHSLVPGRRYLSQNTQPPCPLLLVIARAAWDGLVNTVSYRSGLAGRPLTAVIFRPPRTTTAHHGGRITWAPALHPSARLRPGNFAPTGRVAVHLPSGSWNVWLGPVGAGSLGRDRPYQRNLPGPKAKPLRDFWPRLQRSRRA